eukprot:TRINITY_DN37323_c0_g1_i2.p1 TRINITY_DN37323_c0_g1~~TRINITY_DN37323_c0_g1_i2.p1  ORF type:complete len:169 (+),score=11.17 TRINITY_DN37323_c0_g1_i2:115-621(+)
MLRSLVGSEMCIRDSLLYSLRVTRCAFELSKSNEVKYWRSRTTQRRRQSSSTRRPNDDVEEAMAGRYETRSRQNADDTLRKWRDFIEQVYGGVEPQLGTDTPELAVKMVLGFFNGLQKGGTFSPSCVGVACFADHSRRATSSAATKFWHSKHPHTICIPRRTCVPLSH